jgi:DNA-binding MarR family transcriptional regulator
VPTPSALAGGRCLCGALRRATRALTRHYDEHLAPSGLTIARYSLLSTLARLGTPTLAAYARDLAMDRTTLLRNLRPLVDGGLIAVEPSRGGRSKLARLTARGAAAVRRAQPYWQTAQDSVADRVDREDVERVLAVAAALG